MGALPRSEGVYLWIGAAPLYVGSALSLRARCSSYLSPNSRERCAADLRAAGPLELLAWVAPSPDRWELEAAIWAELRPALNRREPCVKSPKYGSADYMRSGICS